MLLKKASNQSAFGKCNMSTENELTGSGDGSGYGDGSGSGYGSGYGDGSGDG